MSEILNLPAVPTQNSQASYILKAFGLNIIQTVIAKVNVPGLPIDTNEIGRDKPLYNSQFGTPVFSDLNVQSGSYLKNGQTFNFEEIKIDLALFTVSQRKNIQMTAIQGRDGTVKEYIADGDYDINIKGIITSTNNSFPLEAFRALKNVLKAPIPLVVNSWYLNEFGIFNIVVTEYEFIQEPGKFSAQAFNIHAVSDTPIELSLSNNSSSNNSVIPQ